MTWIGLSLRRLSDERSTALAFALLVLLTTLLAAATPRALERIASDALHQQLLTSAPAPRSIQLLQEGRPDVGAGDALETITSTAARLFAVIPPEIQAVIAEQAVVVDSPRFSVQDPTNHSLTLRLRIQPGAERRFHLTAGRMPQAAAVTTAAPNIEIAIASSSAKALGASLGDTLAIEEDTSDPLAGPRGGGTASATIVGLFDVGDPTDPWWLGDPGLAEPITRDVSSNVSFIDTLGFVSPSEYPELLAATAGQAGTAGGPISTLPSPVRVTFREYVDPGRIQERAVPGLVAALHKLENQFPSPNVRIGGGPEGTSSTAMRTSLRVFLETFAASWAAALRVLSIAIVGPAAVALAALNLAAVLAARRRRAGLSLARGRGASMPQIATAVVAEGILVATPAAILGALAAVALVPGDPPNLALAIGLAIIALAVVLLLLASVPAVRIAGLGGGREAVRAGLPSPRRLVFEGLVVVLAVVGAVLLRQRGITSAGATGTLPSADPLATAVPALAGLAAGLLAVRLLPLLIAPLARFTRFTRGLVSLLALRRAASGGTAAVLLVLLATSTIGAFSVAALVHLDRSAEAAAWQTIGADYQITRPDTQPLRAHFDYSSLPGVEASAKMFLGSSTLKLFAAFPVVALLDVSDYELVVAGTPGEEALPVELFGPAVEPLPIMVSDAVATRADGVKVGSTVSMTIQGYTFQARVVGTRASFPGVPATDFFIIANRDQVLGLFPSAPFQPSVAFLRAPPAAAADIRTAAAEALAPASVAGRVELSDGLRDSPVTAAIHLGIAIAAAVAGLYAALAVASALALAGSARAIELAHLRTLGLADRQASGVLLAEHAPAIIVAFAGGLALGIGLFAVLVPSLGLDVLVGSSVQIAPAFDAALLAATAGGVIAVTTIGLGLGILSGRSASPVSALRRGFE
jgi:putative ABC transport system permease protein